MTDRTPIQVLDALTDHGFAPVDPQRIIDALREAGYAIVPIAAADGETATEGK